MTVHPTLGILHIPYTSDLLEQTYRSMSSGKDHEIANLILLFSIFGGAALAWTSKILMELRTTREQANAASTAYTRLAMYLLDSHHHLPASTVALAAIASLAYVITSTEGINAKNYLIRTRCLLMAREMQIHLLDNPENQEERRLKGCNMIEIEIQRRVWWNMVASDW